MKKNSTYGKRKKRGSSAISKKKKSFLWIAISGVALLAIALVALLISNSAEKNVLLYQKKAQIIEAQVLSEQTINTLGKNPAGQVGHAVFISVSDGNVRANVFSGFGAELEDAWQAANIKAEKGLRDSGISPLWVKADAVYVSETVKDKDLYVALRASRHDFFRCGVAFDENYEMAFLEAELNANRVFEYEQGGIDLNYLNNYLSKIGREKLPSLPDSYRIFQCFGWLCDEQNEVYALNSSGLEYGRRNVELIDKAYVGELLENASEFLVKQVKEDGSFIYGIYPRFDNEIENYNILRHASTIWSMICRYRIQPDETLEDKINQTFDFAINELIYSDENTAYLYERKADEIKLGGNGLAIIAMTEYMDVFQNERYRDICVKLGYGILSMLNQETGEYYHVLNGDFTRKEAYRTVYYDGEATFALCRLYSLTGDKIWLDAAQSAVEHFIREDYTKHKDHWVAYSMNEITKHIGDPTYYKFALENAQKNLTSIYERDTTFHTYTELLMVTFEVYDRIIEESIQIEYLEEFDLPRFLKTIYARADRMLDGYFFPEYAMYMENPNRILDTFMVRHDGYRVRIDDVQHNIGGYYLYYKNYEKLVDYGMLDYRD